VPLSSGPPKRWYLTQKIEIADVFPIRAIHRERINQFVSDLTCLFTETRKRLWQGEHFGYCPEIESRRFL
jgi:hypothetical protein